MPAAPDFHRTTSGKTLMRWFLVVFIAIMFLSAVTWNEFKKTRRTLQNVDFYRKVNKDSSNKLDNLQDCRLPSNKDSSNKLDNLQDFRLPRMIYPQPDTLMQTRRDVLTLTPWLAPIVWAGTYNRDILNEQFKLRNVTVGIALFAIKKYVVFLQLILDTAEKFFMVGHNVNYYVFTDHPEKVPNITLAPGRQIITLLSPAYKRWQDVVLRRMEMLHNATRDIFIHQVDYIVSLDVDMKFSDVVGVEILGDLFGTIHPLFYKAFRRQFTYERRPASQAYIPEDEGDFYYSGSFFGGTVSEFYKLTEYCYKGIMMDKENAIEAVWQEESHMNKYFVGKKPTKVLSPEYVYASYMGSPAILRAKRFVLVPKNYAEIRYK